MLSQQLELEAKCNVVKYGRGEELAVSLKKCQVHEYHVA
jgi:hypothetical protein